MSVLKPRNRVLYFRVSEDEFQQFNRICQSTGARSISDLARAAVQTMIHEGNHGQSNLVSEKLIALEAIVSDLNQKINQLTSSLGQRASLLSEAAAAPGDRQNGIGDVGGE